MPGLIGKVILLMLSASMQALTIIILVEVLMEMVIIVDTIGQQMELMLVTKGHGQTQVLAALCFLTTKVFVTVVI